MHYELGRQKRPQHASEHDIDFGDAVVICGRHGVMVTVSTMENAVSSHLDYFRGE